MTATFSTQIALPSEVAREATIDEPDPVAQYLSDAGYIPNPGALDGYTITFRPHDERPPAITELRVRDDTSHHSKPDNPHDERATADDAETIHTERKITDAAGVGNTRVVANHDEAAEGTVGEEVAKVTADSEAEIGTDSEGHVADTPTVVCDGECEWSTDVESGSDDYPMRCPECGARTRVEYDAGTPDEIDSFNTALDDE